MERRCNLTNEMQDSGFTAPLCREAETPAISHI